MTDLVVGRRYKFTMNDCCINVKLTGTVISIEENEWPSPRITWDIGVTEGQIYDVELVCAHVYVRRFVDYICCLCGKVNETDS